MSGAATGGRLSPAAAIGRDALRRVRIGSAALVAAAICVATAPSPSWAADWTDANNVEYTALKYIKGSASGPWIITDIVPTAGGKDTVKFRCKLDRDTSNEAFFCARGSSSKLAFTCFRIGKKIRVQRTSSVEADSTEGVFTSENEYSIEIDFSNGTSTSDAVKINGNGITMNKALGATSYNPPKIVLFASHSSGSNVSASSAFSNFGSYYLYSFQLYGADGTLKHNLMPAVPNTEGAVAGLFDTVTSKFYSPTGPSDYATFTSDEYGANDRAGKKWTGAGSDNLMSNGANWEGGTAPSAGDDLDFTIAVPNAPINADTGLTYGKVYLGTGDLPAFTGSLTVSDINSTDYTRIQAYDSATESFTFTLAAPTDQDFTWNGGAAANWGDAGVWMYNNAASGWYDYNNAIFNTAGATATLAADASAASLAFNASATIAGSSTLTVPSVSVVSSVSATISAPTSGALEKTGAGTLTLGSSRTDATTLSEGTLKMLDGATVSSLTLGTDDATKPVTFDYGGQTLGLNPSTYLVTGSDVTLTNGTFSISGNLNIRDEAQLPSVLTIAKDAMLETTGGQIVINTGELDTTATVNVAGGVLHAGGEVFMQHTAKNGRMNINVTDGGLMEFGSNARCLICYAKGTNYQSPSLYMRLCDSTFRVNRAEANLMLGNDDAPEARQPVSPTGVIAATNSVFYVGNAIQIGRNVTNSKTAGSYTADFEECVVTTKHFEVNCDRPLNNARFNGSRLALTGTSGDESLVTARNGDANWFTVGGNGLTIDTLGAAELQANLGGEGAVTKTGAGTLTVAINQTATAAFNVAEGALALAGGVTMGRTLAVADGATLSLDGTAQATVSNVAFAAGSTLDVASYVPGVVPLAVATSATLPESGTVALTLGGGAFTRGAYAIYTKGGVTAADGDKFTPSTGSETYSWSVVNDTLVLTVGTVGGNFWTGFGGDGKMSTAANWLTRQVPAAGADLDFSGASSAITVNADTDVVYGAVTMGDGMVTFTGSLTASAFVDSTGATNLMNVAVGANATVTIDGDLEPTTQYVVQSIAEGGRFIVTGDLTVAGEFEVLADSNAGSFIVRGTLKMTCGSDAYLARTADTSATVMFGELEATITGGRFHPVAQAVVVGTGGLDMFSISSTSSSPTITGSPTYYALNGEYAINSTSGKNYLINNCTLTLDTTQYGTENVAATVTVNATMLNYTSGKNGGVNVTGCGRVVFNSVSTFTEGTVVSNTATLAVNAGCQPGTGTVTVHDGATLEVAQSGTVTLVGDLTLADGANLGFNFTEKKVAPVLSVATSATLPEGGTVMVKVSAADGIRPKGGSYVLTSGGKFANATVTLASGAPNWVKGVSVADGEIVLDVKSRGFTLIVK